MRCLRVILRQAGIVAALLFAMRSEGQIIIADNFNVSSNGTGFAFNTGVNSGINPPTTRLSGSAAANLHYIPTSLKTNTAFKISSNKLLITPAEDAGRFTLSANGTSAYNFASALETSSATPQNPVVYDLSISMANNTPGTQRFSFALGTSEGDATTWDFGIQVYRNFTNDNFYTIGKRFDSGSTGLGSDINAFITNTAVGTLGTEISFLIRITDAGSQTSAFDSRVQISTNGGFDWFYDTEKDPDLPNGWRLNGSGRYVMWDVAPDAGNVTYDSFSIQRIPISATLIAPANNGVGLGAPVLKAAISNSALGNVTVTFFGREAPTPYPGPDFCIPVLPDTQNYAREAPDSASRDMWYAQTDWIVQNRVRENIVYVAHLGDIVQSGDIKNGNPNNVEWNIATNAMYRLEKESTTLLSYGIPYGLAVGNHDQEPINEPDGGSEFYNRYFGISHFDDRPYYGGHYSTNNDSHFDLFSASGIDFIVLYFEYGRFGSGVMSWANAVLTTNKHRRAIVVTHHAGSATTPSNLSNQGQAIWDELKVHTNFFMMLGGHVTGEGSRQNTHDGNIMRTFISDYQGRTNGGNGWMRLMYFSPTNNQVVIQTYNPWLDRYETDDNSELFFNYSLRLPSGPGSPGTPYLAVATNLNVSPGALVSAAWPGLQAGKTYDWYVTVTDAAGNSFISPPRRFSTSANISPIASNLTVTVAGDQPVPLNLGGFDGNGDPLLFRTNSQPLRGFTSNFNPVNGTITYLPAHGYRGLDRFTYQVSDSIANSATANFDVNVVAPPDTNGNGIPDNWEAKYDISDPNADPDGDGQTNLQEYNANTNPTNALSALRILNAGFEPTGLVKLTWSSIGGTRYRVQYSPEGTNAGIDYFTDIVRFVGSEMDLAPYGTPSSNSYIDPADPATNKARYYRIKVSP
jgi:hypothetical protein